jgi:hypothetical protein
MHRQIDGRRATGKADINDREALVSLKALLVGGLKYQTLVGRRTHRRNAKANPSTLVEVTKRLTTEGFLERSLKVLNIPRRPFSVPKSPPVNLP